MTGRSKAFIAALAIIAVGTCVLISNMYFFNPLLFRRNEITYLPWSWYKKPLQIEYFVREEDGWKSIKSTETAEIRQLFRELHKGLQPVPVKPDDHDRLSIWIAIRRVQDGVVLLALEGYEDSPYFMVRDNVPVELSDSLMELLQKRLTDARKTAAPTASK